jgi:hypothetical protein
MVFKASNFHEITTFHTILSLFSVLFGLDFQELLF